MNASGILTSLYAGLVIGASFASAFGQERLRTWTDSTGNHEVEAELVDIKDGEVRLRKTSGSVLTIPIEKLSKEDQQFVKATREAKPGANAGPRDAEPARTTTLATGGNKGQSFRVVIAQGATEAEKYAADELALHLGRMLGDTIPVVTQAEAGDPSGRSRTRSARPRGWSIRLAHDSKLGPGSYHLELKPAARELLIAGGQPRGVLMGAYSLLADHFGCRWYTPDISYLPTVKSLAVPSDLDETFTPSLEYRTTDWGEAQDADWATRNRLNAVSSLKAKHGGGITFNPFVHSFHSILDPAKEFDAHPEYFSMVGGKRIREKTQLCLSNKDVLRAAIAKAKEWAKSAGGVSIISISQCDWENPCECPDCKAIDDAEDCKSASLIRFVNQVAEAVEEEYPKATIETLAYLYSRKPPKTLKPRHNVIVRLCSIECCFAHPLDRCPEKNNVSFMRDLKGWHKLTDRLYIWDYTINFNHFLMPFPNLNVLDQNMRTFVGNGVKGVFAEGPAVMNCELGELRSWIIAQLLWNPALDDQELQREFVSRVYGPCAATVQEFLDLQRDAIVAAGDHVRVFEAPNEKKYLNDDVLRQCDAKLEKAERIAKKSDNSALVKRIARLRMPIWYTRFIAKRESPDVLRSQARNLLQIGRKLSYTHVDAWTVSWPPFEKTLEEYVSPFQVASPGTKLETMKRDITPANMPFLKSVFFRNGGNFFGVRDLQFDDRKGTMEAWVWCGPANEKMCQGTGMLFEISSPKPESGHRVWVDVDVEKDVFTAFYETWAGGETSRIAGNTMQPNTWHHIAAKWQAAEQSSRMDLYVDGQLAGKAPYQPTNCLGKLFYIGSSDFSIGGKVRTSFGSIDEVRLSNVVRKLIVPMRKSTVQTPHEPDNNTLLLLHFDEPVGDRIKDSSGIER